MTDIALTCAPIIELPSNISTIARGRILCQIASGKSATARADRDRWRILLVDRS